VGDTGHTVSETGRTPAPQAILVGHAHARRSAGL